MFAVIYSFEVRENHEDQFFKAWNGLTNLIYKHEHSLGSRLHKSKENEYIAYAYWPDRETWENSGNNLPEQATSFRNEMRDACIEIKTLFQLNLIDDLLRNRLFDSD